IPKDTIVLEYLGEVKPVRGLQPSEYLMRWGLHDYWLVDATSVGNESRLINHSSFPNLVEINIPYRRSWHVLLFALRDIPKGAPLAFDYGPKYDWSGTNVVELLAPAQGSHRNRREQERNAQKKKR